MIRLKKEYFYIKVSKLFLYKIKMSYYSDKNLATMCFLYCIIDTLLQIKIESL